VLLLPLAALVPVLLAGPEALRAAHVRGDLDEVARQGRRLGAGGLAPLLTTGDPTPAILASTAAADGWELLPDLAKAAGSWDRQVAAPAAHAAVRIARRLDADVAVTAEIPDDALAAAAAAWRVLAQRSDRWADVRVHALEITARLAATRRGTADVDPGIGYDVAALIRDGDPEVRRAAAELLPQPLPADLRAILGEVVASDGDGAVAVAAAQALCADLGSGGDAPAALAALGPPGLARLRLLGNEPPADVPSPALVDAARCLRADDSGESRAALHALAARAPRDVRGRLARLLR